MDHYQSFVKAVKDGVFDGEPLAPYFHKISETAKYIRSPIPPETCAAFGCNLKGLADIMAAFHGRAFVQGKAIPLDELICIEDDVSAVFMENAAGKERTVRSTVYYSCNDMVALLTGFLTIGKTKMPTAYDVSDYNGFFIIDNRVMRAPLNDPCCVYALAQDLVNATKTALEQLAYMDRTGQIKETRVCLH